MDYLQHLTTFVRIAEAGSISQAARGTQLSIAMASRHLSSLEEHFGVELVRRTTRRTQLTPAGEELLARARKLLAEIENTRDALRPGTGAAGLVTVSLPVSFGLSQIAPMLTELLDTHPRLQFDLRFEDRLVDLLGEGVDLAIRVGVAPPDSPFIVARKLASFARILCASPAFLRRHARLETIDDLSRVPCITQSNASTGWKFVTAEGSRTIEVQGRVRTNTILAARDAALAGVGVALAPCWMVKGEIEAGRLIRVLPDSEMAPIDVFGLVHHTARGSQTLRVVLDHIAGGLVDRIGLPLKCTPTDANRD